MRRRNDRGEELHHPSDRVIQHEGEDDQMMRAMINGISHRGLADKDYGRTTQQRR